MVEWSLPTPEVFESSEHLFRVNCIEKTKIKKKEPEIPHFETKQFLSSANPGILGQNKNIYLEGEKEIRGNRFSMFGL